MLTENIFTRTFWVVVTVVGSIFTFNYHDAILDTVERKVHDVSVVVAEETSNFDRPIETVVPLIENGVQSKPIEVEVVDPNEAIKVLNVKEYYLLFVRADGKYELRTGGTYSWRLNNPGKLSNAKYAIGKGSIGVDKGLAIFPTYEQGRQALSDWLFVDGYPTYTLEGALKDIAKSAEGYSAKYAQNVSKASGVPMSTKLGDTTEDQQKKILDAIQKEELFLTGEVRIYENQDDFNKNGIE